MTLDDIARELNPITRGWIAYYGRYTRSALYPLVRYIDQTLAVWMKRKFKRFHHRLGHARDFLASIARKPAALRALATWRESAGWLDGSRVRRESHARFWERPRVKAPRPTRPPVPVLDPGKGKTKTGRL